MRSIFHGLKNYVFIPNFDFMHATARKVINEIYKCRCNDVVFVF